MSKIILSINAGSSSVKISVYEVEKFGATPEQLAEAQISGLTAPPPKLAYTRGATTVCKGLRLPVGGGPSAAAAATELPEPLGGFPGLSAPRATGRHGALTQDDAFRFLLALLLSDPALPRPSDAEADVGVACHRIVHGGEFAARPRVVTPATLHQLDSLSELAPLHNGPSLAIVRSCARELPAAVNVACFDSGFHVGSLPEHVYCYAVDRTVAHANRLRKYGFHGLSYSFIVRAVAEFLGKPVEETSIIALHLGSGASVCAIQNGKSVDTSMGLTPLAGLPGATRSGSVDPSLVFHYASDVGKLSPSSTRDLHISRAEEILNKEAGWKALTGTTDFGVIAANRHTQPGTHGLAFDLFADRVLGFVGSYYVTLGGKVDALVFAGGIGEKSADFRAEVVGRLGCLGFGIDGPKNGRKVEETVVDITAAGAGEGGVRHRTLVCLTDEQFEMARACAENPDLW